MYNNLYVNALHFTDDNSVHLHYLINSIIHVATWKDKGGSTRVSSKPLI